MPIIAVIQQKGGVGKSTIAANLAGELALAHHTVVAFDLDAQRSLVRWAKRGAGILQGRVQAMEFSSQKLFAAAVLEALGESEYVVIDSPPSFAAAAVGAALLADVVLVPVTPSAVDFDTARDTRDLLREIQLRRGDGKPLIAFVPSKVTHTSWGHAIGEQLEKFGERVFPSISQRIGNVDSAAVGMTLREYERTNKGVSEFADLVGAIQQAVR